MKVTCRLCKHSRALKKRADGRYCAHADRTTAIDSDACEHFVCDGLFYCPHNLKYMGITTCIRLSKERRGRKSACKTCEYAINGETIKMLMATAATTVLRRR